MSQRLVLMAMLLALRMCAQQGSQRPSPFPEQNRESSSAEPAEGGTVSGKTGIATFFSSKADGALTASGRRLDTRELVAAHATYPFGSRVKVTNLANGKTVEVQIIDRLPISKRIISVSEAAARLLGFVKAGTAEVRLDLVPQGAASRPPE